MGGNGDPGNSVKMDILISHSLLPVGQPGVFWALVTLTGKRPKAQKGEDAEKGRLPLNMCLVLDRSGSMSGEPLEHVKEAACFVVDQLSAKDRFSLVVFDSDVSVLCPSQEVQYKDVLKGKIRTIQSGSTTNLSGGLLRGYAEVLKANRSGRVNRLVLLTDGMANVGITDPTLLGGKVRNMAENGVFVSAMGVGRHFDEDLLIGMAEAGQGRFYYVKSADEIPKVFEQELTGLLSVVAQGMCIKIRALSGCSLTGVLGYEARPTPEGAALDLPDMYENDVKHLVLGISHPSLPEGEHEVLEVAVDYADATQALAAVNISVKTRLNAGYGPPEAYKPSYEVMKRVELVRTALAKDEAVERSRAGDLDESEKVLESRVLALEELAREHDANDLEVTEEISNLRGLIQRLKEAKSARQSQAPFGVSDGTGATVAESEAEQDLRKELRSQSYQTRRSMPTGRPSCPPRTPST